jgi:Sulfotransferase family
MQAPIQHVFVTGMQRSGTTLVQRVLDAHPQAVVLPQPLPLVFVELKRAFLRARGGCTYPYPLSPLFLESARTRTGFTPFLRRFRITRDWLAPILSSMRRYAGQWHRPPEDVERTWLEGYRAATLDRLLAAACVAFAQANRRGVRVVGSKETTCEEFLAFLAGAGWKVVLVLRDPRDVIASLHYGDGRRYGGARKPLLFDIRQWRKSAAFALALEHRPGIRVVRYERFVRDPVAEARRLASWLTLDPAGVPSLERLRDGNGGEWTGNSSHAPHRGVTSQSVGRYRGLLPIRLRESVEAACLPEMLACGFPPTIDPRRARSLLHRFEDPFPLERPELADYRAPGRLDEELARLDAIEGAGTPPLAFVPLSRAGRLLHDGWTSARCS